jgi:hypothetical protein
MKKFCYMFSICVFGLFVFYLFSAFVFSYFDINTREDVGLDDSISENIDRNHRKPEKILVAQIGAPNMYLANNTESWIRLLHYYTITRLGFADIPFSYIIDRNGQIYEVMDITKGMIPYMDTGEGVILIAYFSESSDISLSAQKALQGLIQDYSYKYGIPKSKVSAVELEVIKGDERSPTLFSYSPSTSLFSKHFGSITEDLRYFNRPNISYTATITDLNYEKEVKRGNKLKVSFKLKNTDDFVWYLDEGLVFLSTLDSRESQFFVNQIWDSSSKPFSLESQVVVPGEEIELFFDLNTNFVLPGKYEEEFEFIMLPDNIVDGSQFSVEFEVSKGDTQIVEINMTGARAITVFECRQFTCPMVAIAPSGNRYVVLEEKDNWYLIHVDGVEGWVSHHYVDLIK